MEILISALVLMDILLLCLFFMMFRKNSPDIKTQSIEELESILKPILIDAQKVADQFDIHLKRKQIIIKRLYEQIDNRIISLNLLMNRADTLLKTTPPKNEKPEQRPVYEVQEQIIALSKKGTDQDNIALQLGVTKGEVSLVLDLKQKFEQMAKDSDKNDENELSFDNILSNSIDNIDVDTIKPDTRVSINNQPKDILKFDLNDVKVPSRNSNNQNNLELKGIENNKSQSSQKSSDKTLETLDAKQVLKYAQKGWTSDQIAKHFGVTKGEIDMMLELKKKFMKMEMVNRYAEN